MDQSKEFQERIGRIEGLLHTLDTAGDPVLRRSARQLVEALMELHGAALERMLEMASSAGEAGASLIGEYGSDPLIGSLLVLYGLHPEDLEARVRRGLENVRRTLQEAGAHWESLKIEGSAVEVKIVGSHDAAEARKLERAVREALLEAAPDATEVHIASGVIGGGGGVAPAAGFVPLARLIGADGSPAIAEAGAQLVKT